MTSISLSPTGGAAYATSSSSLDTNGDGVVSAEELAAANTSSASPRLTDPTVEGENAASGVTSQVAGDVMAMLLSRESSEAGASEGTPRIDAVAGENDDTVSIFDVLEEMSQVIAAYAAHAEAAKGDTEETPRTSISL